MKKLILVAVFLLFASFSIQAQRGNFKSKVMYGPELRLNGANLIPTQEGPSSIGMKGYRSAGFDVLYTLDYSYVKWLGLGTGLGVNSISTQNWKSYYYLSLPLRIQLKMGFFWFEPSIENRFFLSSDKTVGGLVDEEINNYYMAIASTLRFRLYEGLSLSVGLSQSISQVAYREHSSIPEGANTSYSSFAWFVGVRYMFNQPYGKRHK